MTRLQAIVIWLDQGLSAIILKSPDETFSAAAYRKSLRGKRHWIIARKIIDGLFFWQEAHCREAWRMEFMRNHLPNAYRDGTLNPVEYKHCV